MTTETTTPPANTPPTQTPAPVRRSRLRRLLRALGWTLLALVLLAGVIAGGAWWWLGSDQSLAFSLSRAARYLPAGQTLESRDVHGSLRRGGRIGWLRYQSPALSVEVKGADIGWQLEPLLKRKVELGEIHAAEVLIERRGPAEDKPVQPLEPIVLPVEVDLPFRIDRIRWAGPPPLEATQLEGRYRYTDSHHLLDLKGVDVADGHYSGNVKLQGPAPMAIEAALAARVQAPLTDGRRIEVTGTATAKGTLAGNDARLEVAADLKPADTDAAAPMQAQLLAHLAPWLPQPVIDAKADLQNVNLASLLPTAPVTQLSGQVLAGPGAAGSGIAWQASADIRNALPGPWDNGKLPVEQVQGRAQFDGDGTWTVPAATVRAGGGRIDASGQWRPAPAPWQGQVTVRNVRPGDLHTKLAGAPVSGRANVEQRDEAVIFDVDLQAQGGAGSPALQGVKLERALAQGQWKNQVLDLRTLRIDAARTQIDGTLQLRVAEQAGSGNLRAVLPGGSAKVQGRIAPAQGSGEVQATVADAAALQRWIESLPGLSKVFAGTTVQGNAQLDARWQGGWQSVQRRLQNASAPAPRGTAEPTLQATLNAPRLDLRLPAAASTNTAPAPASNPIQLRGLRADIGGSLAQATLSLQGDVLSGTQKLTLDTKASGGIEATDRWRAAIASLRLQAQDTTRPGPWTLTLRDAVSATVRTGASQLEIETSAGGATLQGPVPGTVRLDWQPVRLRQSGTTPNRALRVQSKGTLQGLPMAWAQALSENTALADAGITGDLLFDGAWDIDAGDMLRASASLTRQSGDIRVQAGEAALVTRIRSHGAGAQSEITMETSTGAQASAPPTPAGVRQAEIRVQTEGDAVRANLVWDSERAGELRAEASTRVQQRDGGWQWAEDAPLAGRVTARLPSLGVWSMLAPPGWRVAGTLNADATLSGTRVAPRWTGTLGADQLALKALVEGIDLRDGRLRATLSGDRVDITEFTLKGGTGSSARIAGQSGNRSTVSSEAARDGGTLSARGNLSWGAAPAPGTSGIRMDLQGQLRALRLLVRSDRQVTLSGDLQAKLDAGQLTVRGNLKTDRAVIILPDETAPSLGTDVVVRSAAKDKENAAAVQREMARNNAQIAKPDTAKPPDIAVNFNLGDDFAVQGRGITTRLEGELDIRTTSLSGPPRITGEVRTVKGQYRAYGQQLDVETGLARFNGPFDNPSLDILAIRPNISQRAGVQVTGTAQAPRVRLYSQPALSDVETLSWVVLGRASATSGGESVLLQQAALALLGGLGKGGTGGSLASRFGLDEIGFKGPGSGGDVRESAVTVGKRLANDFYLTYERSLAGTLGTLYIFYDLTQRLTLRGQAGLQSGIDLIYTLKYD